MSEPLATAFLLATFGLLMVISVLLGRTAERLGVPIVLLFLVLGMLGGSEGLLKQALDDYEFAFRIGTLALVLILFDGGLNTSVTSLKKAIGPASVLATVGVAITALLVALCARLMGFDWSHSLLLGAVVSSTDAATVFAVLRGSRLNLQKRVGLTLELESGLNDPMAVILTATITQAAIIGGEPLGWSVLWEVPVQLLVGALSGIALGFAGAYILRRIHLRAGGLFPVITLGLALLSFGITTMLHGSGFLAVYATALIIGNCEIPYRTGLARIHDAVAWLGQTGMFLMLGLLVFPSQLLDVAWQGVGLALFLAFIARPVATAACLLPFRYPRNEIAYIGWVGLRGAVPIILATFPVLAQVDGAMHIFNLVFFIVVVNALIPGATLRWITRRMKLDVAEPPAPAAALEINSTQLLKGEILSFYVDDTLAVCGVPLSSIRFPEGSSMILVVRGQELLAARGYTVIEPGDHVYVFCRPEVRPYIELLFGKAELSG
jgi:cell volume regulation protein A